MDQFRVDGPAGILVGETHGARTADRTPILFLHPINLRGRCWRQVARAVGGDDRFCLLPDLRGHGDSTPRGPFGLKEWGDDCLTVLDHFGVERVHLVGGSLGGPLAVHLAARIPDQVESVSAFGSALTIRGPEVSSVLPMLQELGVRGMFAEAVSFSLAPGSPAAVVEDVIGMSNPNDVDTVTEIWTATVSVDVTESATSVRCPVSVATGEHDRTCPPDQGAEMAQRFGSHHVVIADVGHLAMVEAPDTAARLLKEHLSRAESA